jgi:CRISPR-associated protein Cas1
MELILNSFGTTLAKQHNSFVIKHKDGIQHVPADQIKTITIGRGAQITSDAALLAVEMGIEVLFVDNSGMPVGRLWSVKYGSISNIRRNQLDFTLSPKAVTWIKNVVIQKLDNQIALLLSLMPTDDTSKTMVNAAINRITDYKTKIKMLKGEVVSDIAPSLRGWEGAASKTYFEVIAALMPEKYKFNGRSQHPATDVFNCLLNYAYGILYGRIEGALIKAGIDPYVGVFHRDDYNRPVLVFDIIEIYRVWADYVVINLCMQQAVTPECYSIRPDGSFWLENLGRRIVIQSMNDYLNEIIMLNGLERTRLTHIELYAHQLAKTFEKA